MKGIFLSLALASPLLAAACATLIGFRDVPDVGDSGIGDASGSGSGSSSGPTGSAGSSSGSESSSVSASGSGSGSSGGSRDPSPPIRDASGSDGSPVVMLQAGPSDATSSQGTGPGADANATSDASPAMDVLGGGEASTAIAGGDGGISADSSDAGCTANTMTDPANCGTCGRVCLGDGAGGVPYCSGGSCATTTDVTKIPGFWIVAGTAPHLVTWSDSIFTGVENDDLATGAKRGDFILAGDVTSAGSELALRPTAFIQGGVNKQLITHHTGPIGWDYVTPQYQDWNYGGGCCDTSDGDGSIAVDAAAGFYYYQDLRASLVTGKAVALINYTTYVPPAASQDYFAVDANVLYRAATGVLVRDNFTTQAIDWHVPVGPVASAQLGPPAFVSTASDDVAVASPAGALALLKGDATMTTLWTASFTAFATAPLRPITVATGPIPSLAPSGLVLESTGDPALVAFDVGTGHAVWTFPAPGRVSDVIVGNAGVVYVLVGSTASVYGLDVTTGKALFTYGNLAIGSSAATEFLLRGGRLYVDLNLTISSFPVPSTGYDPTSAWPARFHDNQRTSCKTSPTDM